MIRLFLKLFFFFLVTLEVNGQENYPQSFFIPPLDIPLKLSGTFGELRSDHFHSGMDIKTGEVEGLNVYAIADGYVSRIKIQTGGYGKALYISHPNGYVSVYGHLSRFNDIIGNYVNQEQYRQESYTIDLYPGRDKFKVKKGDIIAYSGNTGSSGGPHLHFEIRDEASQKPINPLLFGYNVTDGRAPIINLIKIYPYAQNTLINGKNRSIDIYPISKNNFYFVKKEDSLRIGGPFYLGVNTVDLFNGGMNKNGVYKISLWLDSMMVYEHDMETFSFDETRYINSLIDYGEYKRNRRQVQKTYVQPNNKLSIYGEVKHHGVFNLNDGEHAEITYKISDVAGNESVLSFSVIGAKPGDISNTAKSGTLFEYNTDNTFVNENVLLKIPEGALYDTMFFNYRSEPPLAGTFSPLHHLHDELTPLQKYCTLSIKADSLPVHLENKALIAKLDDEGDFESVGGYYQDGFIHCKIRSFGKYCILVDTIPPEIIPVNIQNNKSLLAQHSIKVKIKDELSGIDSYRGTLNGKWILMEYDQKNDLLTYYFDQKLQDGENDFELMVTDEKGNQAKYKALLKY